MNEEQSPLSPLPERPNYFRAYSGITEKQFQQCVIIQGGIVTFDKSRSISVDPETYYCRDLTTAYIYACDRASGVNRTPLVMSGLLENKFKSLTKLESDLVFPVDTVWVAYKRYWRTVWDDLAYGDPQKILGEGLKRFNPIEYLDYLKRMG